MNLESSRTRRSFELVTHVFNSEGVLGHLDICPLLAAEKKTGLNSP